MSASHIRAGNSVLAASIVFAILSCLQPARADDELAERIYEFAYDYDLPGVGYAVIVDGSLTVHGAVGERKYDSGIEVEADDVFHLGSCTKAMTATLIGKLVELGQLRWDSTLVDIFPELGDEMHRDYRIVTVNHLLEMRAGFPRDVPNGTNYQRLFDLTGTPTEQRLAYLRLILAAGPENAPGSEHLYSNAGYSALGAMAERVTGRSWEQLMHQYIFQPLRMTSAGFGEMAAPGGVDAPWQHVMAEDEVRPIAPGSSRELPDVKAPGGKVHVSMSDWSNFIQEHLAGARGRGRLLSSDTYKRLHSSHFGDYACGWNVQERAWSNGIVFSHSGTNKKNYSVVWMAPGRAFAVMVATNIEYEGVSESCDKIVWFLIQRYLLSE